MLCQHCGEKVPQNAAFCPFCATDLHESGSQEPAPPPAAVPPPPPPPMPHAPPPAPVYTAPPAPPPLPLAAPVARSSSSGIVLVVVAAAVLLLLVVGGGLAAYVAVTRQHPTLPTETTAAATTTQESADTPGTSPDAEQPTGKTSPPAADQTQPSGAADKAGTDSLSKYAGKWEFVGEPSPWGEGFGMDLRVENGKLLGTSGTEGFEVKIELREKNGGLEGQSTDSDNGTIPLEIQPTDNAGVMTLKYRVHTGEWLTRVIKRQGGSADWVS